MNLQIAQKEIIEFKERICQSLQLQNDQDNIVETQRLICKWLKQQRINVKNQLEDEKKKNTGIIGGIRKLGLMKSQKDIHNIELLDEDLKKLQKNIISNKIPNDFTFQSTSIPSQIKAGVQKLKNKQWKHYYAYINAPFLTGKYIAKKQHFHRQIQEFQTNNLKFVMIEEKVAHHYQRNLVQQIFGRVLRPKGSLTIVIKAQVGIQPFQDSYNLFCYIEDVKFKQNIRWKPIQSITIVQNDIYVEDNGKKLGPDEQNIIQIQLSEILILPVQSLVSNYIVQLHSENVELIKCNEQNQTLIVKQQALQSHPALRNPLLYFTSSQIDRSAKISKIQAITNSSDLFSGFYRALNLMVELIIDDFSNMATGDKIVHSSLCFNSKVFESLWNTFHKIVGMKSWLKEVIYPIKQTISSSQIFTHFCPIFNQLCLSYANNIQENRQFFQNVQIQSYLTTFIKKKTLQKYKTMFVDMQQSNLLCPLNTHKQVYNEIFKPILQVIDLEYFDTVESIYILDFICKHKFMYQPNCQQLPSSWRHKNIWKKCINYLKEERLKFIDISFDIMAYSYGFDTFDVDPDSFERIRYTKENQTVIKAIEIFVKIIREKWSQTILSSLLQKAFKHKKYDICQKLMEHHVRIRDFRHTFSFQELTNPKFQKLKEKIMKKIKQDSPQMHRVFKWQQLFFIEFQKSGKQIETFDYGKCFIPEQILSKHLKDGVVINNLSRKDYKFDPNREIVQVDTDFCKIFYIEKLHHPLLNYFYKIFYKQLEISEILPFFTTFFYENKLFTIVEHIPDSINYQKGLSNFSEQQLNIMADQKLVAQGIITTLALLPKQIHLKDIIISPSKNQRDQLFIIDLNAFYSKNFLSKSTNTTHLNCKNSLFLFDIMHKMVHPAVAKKYAELDVMKFVTTCFEEYSKIIQQIGEMRKRNCDQSVPNQQFLALVFENGFILNLTERLFKIKRLFSKKGNEKGISYLKVIEVLCPCVYNYYYQLLQNQNNLLKREQLLFNENHKRPFVNSMNLVQFFGNFWRLEQDEFQFPDHYYKFCFNGPSESLTSLTTNLKRYTAFENQLPEDLEHYTNQFFQYYIRNVDTIDSDIVLRQKLLDIIKKRSKRYLQNPEKKLLPLTYIRVKSIENTKQKYIHSFSYERVQELVLEDCKIGDYQINNMPSSIENITYLQLKGIRSLKYIGENVLFGNSIQIKHLKSLSITQCEQLVGIDLKCDILENMEIKNNPLLENVYLFSNFLKNIYCTQNPKINLQNIGMYILKGINVIMCKTACRGDIMKLYTDSYDKYIVKILKFMLSRFFDPEARYYMILTLSKLQEVDDSLFAMSGITSFKGFSTVFNKFSTDVEDKILKSILKIFFKNPNIKSLSVNLLTSSPAGVSTIVQSLMGQVMSTERTLRLMSQQLKRCQNVSSLNQIIIERPKIIFANLNTSQYFMEILEFLRCDKNFNITIENLQMHEPNAKSDQQIRYGEQNERQRISKSMSSSDKKDAPKINNDDISDIVVAIQYLAAKKKGRKQLNLYIKNSFLNKTLLNEVFQNDELALSWSIKKSFKKKQNIKVKKFQEVANKYKDGLINMIDKKFMKKTDSMLSDDYNVANSESPSFCIKKIQIENTTLYQEPQREQIMEIQKQIQDQSESQKNYNSVKHLKLTNCELYSLKIFSKMPRLTNLCLNNIKINKNFQQNEQNLYDMLEKRQLHSLQLSNFFKRTENRTNFKKFCNQLKHMKYLRKLAINNNQLTIDDLTQLDNTLNQTKIRELIIRETTVIQSDQTKIKQKYKTFLQKTQNLKSLSIQFQRQAYLQSFIISLSNNQSIVELNIQTNSEISSKILEPLQNNNTLSFIRSNMNYPTWLLCHIKSNTNVNYRKSAAHNLSNLDSQQIMIENAQNNNVFEIMNTSSASGKLTADFHRIGLSLDGGGMRGMLLATEMHYLAKEVGQPLHKIFDCMGGTSIGGILALAATGSVDGINPICSSEQIVQIFTKYGKDIFKKSQIMQFRNLFYTKYSPTSFEGVLKNYFKDSRISDVLVDTNVVVTAVNRMDNKDYIFRSRQALLNSEKDFYMRDIARATSAAPTYFPSAEIKNINATMKLSLLDGGMGMNNPSKLVIDQIRKISSNSGNDDNYFLLSLGTGRLPSQTIPQSAGLKDISPIIDSFTQSANYFTQRDLGDHYKGHFLRVSPLINIPNKKDGQLDNTSDQIVKVYRDTGIESAKKFFKNTIMFGKYRNMNLIEWLQENTARKYDV